MSKREKRGVSLWFLLVALFVGLLSGYLVNNTKMLNELVLYYHWQKIDETDMAYSMISPVLKRPKII